MVSLEVLTPTIFKVTLTVQDKNRAFDWVNMNLEFSGVSESKLLNNSALKAVDMQEGVNVKFDSDGLEFGFGSDEYLSSPLHLRAKNLKYEESSFSL